MGHPGAQAQTRSNILKAGTWFEVQKQFLANVEDAIASPVDIPSSIARYQKTLQYASTPLDYIFGIGLYLAPSDMELHMGNAQGYNNEIVIAGTDAVIGHNPGMNESEPISETKGDKAFQRKIAPPAGTGSQGTTGCRACPDHGPGRHVCCPCGYTASTEQSGIQPRANAHEEEKTALVTAGIALGLAALWLVARQRSRRRPDGP